MPALIPLEMVEDVPVARLGRHRVFDRAVYLTANAIRRAIAEGHPHLAVNACAVAFRVPALADRLRLVRHCAAAADGRLRIAMVVPSSFIDPERFGVVAAGNYGLAAQVFEHETDAIAWLRAERAAELRRGASLPMK